MASSINLYLVEENGSYQWLEKDDIGRREIVTKIKTEKGGEISEVTLRLIAKKLQDHLLADDKAYNYILRRSEKFNLSYEKRNIHDYSESRICAYIKKEDENEIIACTNIEAPKFCPAIIFRDDKIYEIFNSDA